MIRPGAGHVIQIPLSEADGTEPAYLVQPTSHAGRVVTGVIFVTTVSDHSFSHSAIAFADKLAEQSYKVLIVSVQAVNVENECCGNVERMRYVAEWFRQSHDIQRLAAIGFEEGADAVLDLNDTYEKFDCFIAISPIGLRSSSVWTPKLPILIVVGEKSSFCQTEQFKSICQWIERTKDEDELRDRSKFEVLLRVMKNQTLDFAFSDITNEDAVTQCYGYLLDWLLQYLHRFAMAACTSDSTLNSLQLLDEDDCLDIVVDPWLALSYFGRNGPFQNVGLQRWRESRSCWLIETHPRMSLRYSLPRHEILSELSNVQRTFDLPQPTRLGDVVTLLTEVWEYQQ
uniref:Uncharacterized protein AlNc14C13G1577 n=1 Tax=Albugo laibachii Nc14 TaxID=890382 RepID=F0W3L5_9STRA|nr:conserved hypothetical protein [Albugo laibachii Nc14]CCA16278.1 conserved hypothetical protein [Albugo laibachii Nc14]|eukprot:CCA16278.1 conserved hypothetical protein [Albugo laibachii Nc14]